MEKLFYTRQEVADMFGVKPRTLWHWEQKGWLMPAFHSGGYFPRYTLEDIEKAVQVKIIPQRRPNRAPKNKPKPTSATI